MISRQQVASAYNCCIDYARVKIRRAGIPHSKYLSMEEFREVIKTNGWPDNPEYEALATRAMKSPIQLAMFQPKQ